MGDRLAGKVAIVTGAGSNIGRGVAQRFAREGAKVAVVDIDAATAAETVALIEAEGGQARAYETDVSNEDAVRDTVDAVVGAWGGLHVLHNNAVARSRTRRGAHPILDLELEQWRREFDVNVLGMALGCKYAIPHMIHGGGGSILNTTSVNGMVGDLHRPKYGMMKAAIINLTMSVATLHGRDGIRCNAIAPGNIPRGAPGAHPYGDPTALYVHADRAQVIPRRGTPEDIASLAVFLACDESSFITGRTIVCDGGLVGVTNFDFGPLNDIPAP
jgi:NAD(P)-dependent dehydrogenase (short-subunit alcohol dehydrogenase family)